MIASESPATALVEPGRLARGDFGPADPALDLVAARHLLDDGPRAAFRTALGCDDLGWARGEPGRRTLDRLLRDTRGRNDDDGRPVGIGRRRRRRRLAGQAACLVSQKILSICAM